MRDASRRPSSGDNPTPPPNDGRRAPADQRTPSAEPDGKPPHERSWIRATRSVPHKAPPRWAKPAQPTSDAGSGARPNENPAPNAGDGHGRERPRERPRARPAPRDDRAPADSSPGTARTEAPAHATPADACATEITDLRRRGATDRDKVARLQTDDTSPGTADAGGPGTPDKPGPPAPPDHPEDPERDKPEPSELADLRKELDAAKAKNADLEKQLDAANTKNTDLESRFETFKAEADAKLDSLKAEHATELDAAKAEFDAKLESAQNANDAKMTAFESRVAAAIDGLQAKDQPPEPAGPDARADGPEHNDVGSSKESDRLVGGTERQEREAGRKWSIHRGPSDGMFNFLQAAVAGGVTAGAYEMAASSQHFAGWATYGTGVAVAGIAWIRAKLKSRDK